MIGLNLGLNLCYSADMIAKRLIILASLAVVLLAFAAPSSAQTKDSKASSEKTGKTAPAKKPKVDIDGFFKDAEKQTRDAQKHGGSNCVPKPIDQTPTEPVT